MAAVLVVDDDMTPGVLASHLRILGHSVQVAPDPKTALQALAQTPFDVVFCGLRMASVEFMREIRWRWPDVVVLVTAYATAREATDTDRDDYDYLVEGLTVEQVSHLLDRVLEERPLTRH